MFVAFAEDVDRVVDGNSPQHAFHRLFVVLQQMGSGKHLQKGLLHHLLRLLGVAQDPQAAVVNAFAKQIVELQLRLLILTTTGSDYVCVSLHFGAFLS